MNSFRCLLVVSLVFVGCILFEAEETRYLQSAQGRATPEEVKQRLGPPALTRSTEEGESVWVYQVREQQPGSRITAPGTWCDEYVLTFDGQGILRRWTHRSQFHGGELMPTYCVSDGFNPAS
jgi:hypothetical protein